MPAPAYYKLESVVQGDTWAGVPNIRFTRNGLPPETSIAEAKLTFIANQDASARQVLDSEGGTVVILDPDLWTLEIPPQKLLLEAGPWRWQMTITDDQNAEFTYLQGQIDVLPRSDQTPPGSAVGYGDGDAVGVV